MRIRSSWSWTPEAAAARGSDPPANQEPEVEAKPQHGLGDDLKEQEEANADGDTNGNQPR